MTRPTSEGDGMHPSPAPSAGAEPTIYRCRACDFTTPHADACNTHHDVTGHNLTHRAHLPARAPGKCERCKTNPAGLTGICTPCLRDAVDAPQPDENPGYREHLASLPPLGEGEAMAFDPACEDCCAPDRACHRHGIGEAGYDRRVLLDAAEKYEAEARELAALYDDERMGHVSRERARALRRMAEEKQ